MLITILYLQELQGAIRMIPRAPRWQSYVAQTTEPMFTPEQCRLIIEAGHREQSEEAKVGGGKGGKHDTKKRVTTISWIPFSKMPDMYRTIENQLKCFVKASKIN